MCIRQMSFKTADAHEVWCRLTADESCARRVDLLIGERSSGSSKDQVVDVGVEARTARVTDFLGSHKRERGSRRGTASRDHDAWILRVKLSCGRTTATARIYLLVGRDSPSWTAYTRDKPRITQVPQQAHRHRRGLARAQVARRKLRGRPPW